MSKDDAILLDILKAAKSSKEFMGGLDMESFLNDSKTQSSVIHQLLILGEGVKRLSIEFRNQNKTIPWKEMAGMRDKLIHDYNDVDLEAVWTTVNKDISSLIKAMEAIVPRA